MGTHCRAVVSPRHRLPDAATTEDYPNWNSPSASDRIAHGGPPNMTTDTKISQHMNRPLQEVDPEIAEVLCEEGRRQGTGLELIPSENFVSEAVL